jgi:hypothetical protein
MDFACLLAQESLVRAEAAVNEFERVEYFLKAGGHLVILNCGTDVGEDRQFSRSRDEWTKYERRRRPSNRCGDRLHHGNGQELAAVSRCRSEQAVSASVPYYYWIPARGLSGLRKPGDWVPHKLAWILSSPLPRLFTGNCRLLD